MNYKIVKGSEALTKFLDSLRQDLNVTYNVTITKIGFIFKSYLVTYIATTTKTPYEVFVNDLRNELEIKGDGREVSIVGQYFYGMSRERIRQSKKECESFCLRRGEILKEHTVNGEGGFIFMAYALPLNDEVCLP